MDISGWIGGLGGVGRMGWLVDLSLVFGGD